MGTKADISDQINELLGLELESLAKMTKDDLEELLKVVEDSQKLIRIGWKNLRNKAKREILEEIAGRPLLEEFFEGLKDEGEEEKGPLGLGILPRLRKRIFREEE